MSAAAIAHTLGAARKEGHGWRCRCPLHGGVSLTLRDGEGGRLLVTCWGGCDRLDVLAELRQLGLFDGRNANYKPPVFAVARRDNAVRDASCTARTLAIWHKARPIKGTIAEVYLHSRGISFDEWPETLRFHTRCQRPKAEDGTRPPPLPAMVALVEHVKRGRVAVHCTYLRPDGSAKADLSNGKQKAMFGPVAGGAVRFGMPREGEWLAVAEGIETTLAVATACSIPSWAALSAGGIKNLILPPEASMVLICADNDGNGVGQRAAHDAAQRLLAEGRRVRIALPPQNGTDFNDLLTGGSTSTTGGGRDVAA
jgi:putative DNA primase/helicase